jgi:hypothetical protein
MAEQEIIKHTKKTYSILKSKKTKMKEKFKEILVEILIIIFAVSVSIGLHNWSEKNHNKNEEKEFLLGLKEDLKADILNMKSSLAFYKENLTGINYFLRAEFVESLNQDSINIYKGVFFNSTELEPHIGRYEGFKSSGKFSIIKNKDLLNNIISLHESNIKRIQNLNEKHYKQTEKIETLISQNIKLAKNGVIINASEIVNRSDFKIILNSNKGLISNNIVPAHQLGIEKSNEIIKQIEKELK